MKETPLEAAKGLVYKLKGSWHGTYGKVLCPAHNDRNASLSVSAGHKAVLFKCFAGCSTREIISALQKLGDLPKPQLKETAPPKRRDLSQFARLLFSKALPLIQTPAQRYLEKRAIAHSTIGRFEPAAVAYENGEAIHAPALLLPIHDQGQIVALHRIFLDYEGNKCPQIAEPKRTLGNPQKGCIKIGAIANNHLNIAEGFEEAESVIAIDKLQGCWSVNGIEFYARIEIPDSVQSITIYSQHGKAAQMGIEKGWDNLCGNGREITVKLPPIGGDWNDSLRLEA